MAINAPVNDDFKNADQAIQPCIHGAFKNVDQAIQPCIHGAINKYVDLAIQPCMRYYKILDLIVSPRPPLKMLHSGTPPRLLLSSSENRPSVCSYYKYAKRSKQKLLIFSSRPKTLAAGPVVPTIRCGIDFFVF